MRAGVASKTSRWKRAARGIYYRTQVGRKHGVRGDRYYVLKHSAHGMQMTEALGWESDGWTLEIAQEVLSRLQAAKRTGRGPVTLREEADANRQAERGRREEIELLERNQK